MPRKAEKDLTLTRAEVILVRGLKAQEQLLAHQYQAQLRKLQDDMAHVREAIEQRLALPPGAVNAGYQVDLDEARLVPVE